MSRAMTGAFLAALTAQDLRPAVFFEGDFPSGFLRLWTGTGDIVWNAQTWTGAGNLMGIGSIDETGDVVATGTSVSLSGVPSAMVASVIVDAQQGRAGKLWLGFLDAAGAIIADPVLMFAGRLDVPQINDSSDTCTVTISYESRLMDLNRARSFRYTDESQKVLSPGDRGFEYVTVIQQRQIDWGQA